MQVGFAWECTCGEVVYAEESPEECLKCGALDSHIRMPEEILKNREQEIGFEEEKPIKKVKKTKSAGRKK